MATSFSVPWGLRVFGRFVANTRSLWVSLGNFESELLGKNLKNQPIEAPIYVTGLARSGSTILLEMLASQGDTVSHYYRDFPPLYTPCISDYYWRLIPKKNTAPIERTHKDGLMVTPQSPEALEEILWMTFFSHLHDTNTNNVLREETANKDFERFYTNHIKKLLLKREGNRYLAKGNYNITRIPYILKLFPDARFVIPIRDPLHHIASLHKQHQLFCKGEKSNPAMLNHLQRIGHFEFGIDRRPINTGDTKTFESIQTSWALGEEIKGWAKYWAYIYNYLFQLLEDNSKIKEACIVIRYEDLCEKSEETITSLCEHCALKTPNNFIENWAEKLHYPTYYQPNFTEEELAIIARETKETAEKFGYISA